MGFLDKMKNLFTEEVEEEIKPQKREEKIFEPVAPKKETIVPKEKEIPVRETRLEESKEKFVFPVYFDDKDFDDLEKPKVKEKPKNVVPKEVKKEPYQGAKVSIEPEPKKIFKPSPIISPVYGVLDKNYSKDDITTKKESRKNIISKPRKQENMTIDDIRNKAYGTLEDDLESTLAYDFSELNEKPKHGSSSNQEALDIFNELDFDSIDTKEESFTNLEKKVILDSENIVDDDTEQLARQLEEQKKKLEEISQYINENESDIEEIKEEPKSFIEEEIDSIEEENSDMNKEKNLNDSELFDLIDSMYEKKEDDE